MSYDFILAIDPSGSFNEGKGTTGWCVLNVQENRITLTDSIEARHYKQMEIYWHKHLDLIDEFYKRYKKRMVVVIEDYFLYASKTEDQINSRMETCKLIGILQHHCWLHNIPYKMQVAGEVKSRWSDDILEHKNYISKKGKGYQTALGVAINRHCKDAIRHAVHYATFKNKKEAI